MLTFATKKLSTGANGQKEDAASFFCPRSFDRAVMAGSVTPDDDRLAGVRVLLNHDPSPESESV